MNSFKTAQHSTSGYRGGQQGWSQAGSSSCGTPSPSLSQTSPCDISSGQRGWQNERGWSQVGSSNTPSLSYNQQKQGWSQAGYSDTSSTFSSQVDRQQKPGWSRACRDKTSCSVREFDWSAYREASSFTMVDWDHEVDQVLLEEFQSMATDISQRQGFIADICLQLQEQGLKRDVSGVQRSRSWTSCFNPGESQRVPPRGPPGL